MTKIPLPRRDILIYLCLALTTAIVYLPVRHFQFINFDDRACVYENPHIQSGLTLRGLVWACTANYASNWYPLIWLSHMLVWQLWGTNAGAHHLVNVLFHIANTLLLFGVLRRMTAAPWRSGFVAALFALHPLHVEPVVWVTSRTDVLSTFFWMLTLWAYVKYVEQLAVLSSQFPARKTSPLSAFRSPLASFYALSLLFFTLGLMSKPMVVTLPFVLLLLDYWPLGRTRWAKPAVGERAETSLGRLVMEKLPFLVLVAASCVTTVWAQRSGGAVPSLEALAFGDRVANAVVSYAWYIGKMFWPTGLAVPYPYHEWPLRAVLWAGAVLLGLSGLVVWRARREPYLAVGWLWYVGTLVPAIGLVQAGGQAAADRYTYLPLIGLFIMLAWVVPDRIFERRPLDATDKSSCARVSDPAQVSTSQMRGLPDDGDLRSATTARSGDRRRTTVLPGALRQITAVTASALLGLLAVLCRFQVGYWKNSETLFRRDLEVTRDNWVAHNNLALALCEAGKLPEATEYFERALRLRPEYAESHYNLGLALAGQGRLPEAIEQWKQSVQINPDYAEALFNLGVALQQTGKPQEAVGHFEQAVRVKPDFAEAYYNLGNALVLSGKPEDSIKYYQDALRLKPNYAAVHYNLAVVLAQAGKTNDAIMHYGQVLAIQPDSIDAQNKLAWLLATLPPAEGGDPVRAVTLAGRACALTSNRVPAYLDTLAAAYAATGRFDEAIASGQKALELARTTGQWQLAGEIEGRLKLYRTGHIYHQPQTAVQGQSVDVTNPRDP